MTLEARVEQLESIEAIRRLSARVVHAIDEKDIDTLVDLFVDDIRLGGGRSGRAALREDFEKVLSSYRTGIHHLGNHVIEFETRDKAHGVVYGRAECEFGDDWVIIWQQYYEDYERRDGRWLIARRRQKFWYATEWGRSPAGPDKMRVPDSPKAAAQLPEAFTTWVKFWEEHGDPRAVEEPGARSR